ncbi:hypothetical protein ABB02_01693 [Clostridiaceae bacterium JG1575]|nr:hypothetical protein ABB02_01693 [Clostridiaceae bacterium JG1575]
MEYLVDFFEPIFKMRFWTKLIRSIWDNQIPLFCSIQVTDQLLQIMGA